VDPAEDEGKRDRGREQAAPEEELVHPPSPDRTMPDEGLAEQVSGGHGGEAGQAAQEPATEDQFESLA
jgi:hypothetical protein